MLILKYPLKLRLLEELLKKSLPQALTVHGAVMNINRGNPMGHEAIVDSWPDFQVVLTRPCKKVVSDPSDLFANSYGVFFRNLDAFRRLLENADVVNWTQTFKLRASKAMLILKYPLKLRLLEELLKKSLPQALTVHGAVMNINRGNPMGHEAIVDSWPDFQVVLTRPCKKVVSDPSDLFANSYGVFFRNLDAFRRLLENADAVNWTQTFSLRGPQDGIDEAIQDAAAAKQTKVTAIPYFTYLLHDPNNLREPRIEPGFTLSSLNSSHVDLLNQTWAYGGSEQSHKYLANMIKHFPSAGILNPKGDLISWNLLDLYGTSSAAYTLPSYRGKGYSAIANKSLAMQAHAAGYPTYGLVALDNIRMQNLLKNRGYQKLPELSHVCFHSAFSA